MIDPNGPGLDAPASRDQPWLMRTYAGHSSARESNALFRMSQGLSPMYYSFLNRLISVRCFARSPSSRWPSVRHGAAGSRARLPL